MDYAEAVNAEIRDLFAAGADVVQIDEPYMQARPEEARKYGLKALNAALDGVWARPPCTSASAMPPSSMRGPARRAIRSSPSCQSAPCQQISIETAQSNLDCSVLEGLPGKQIILGVIDLSDMTIETPDVVAERIRKALHVRRPRTSSSRRTAA